MSESLKWIKSTYSAQGNCVEVASRDDGLVVRDSKQGGTGPLLRFPASSWRRFADRLKADAR